MTTLQRFIPFLLPYLYIIVHVFFLNCDKKLKIFLGLIITLVGFKDILLSFAGGPPFAPELPRLVMLIAGTLTVTELLFFFSLILKDIATVILKICKKPISGNSLSLFLTLGGLCLVVALYGLYGSAIKTPPVVKYDVTLSNLPKEFDGFKIVQLSDLHISSLRRAPQVAAIVKSTNSLNPDAIFLTGDMIDGYVADRAPDVLPLKDLKATYGVYGVVGNHEYYSGYNPWVEAFKKLNVKMLMNSNSTISKNGKELAIVGVTDPQAVRMKVREYPNIDKATLGLKEDTVKILLAHQPKNAPLNAKAGITLQLSGHTHGGMILPFRPFFATFNNGYVAGWYNVENMKLYVANGAGLWGGFPFRLGVPAEIVEITLHTNN